MPAIAIATTTERQLASPVPQGEAINIWVRERCQQSIRHFLRVIFAAAILVCHAVASAYASGSC